MTAAARKSHLSRRQADCLQRVALGETTGEIAYALRLSARTVDGYIADACSRLGTKRRASAAIIALRSGLIELPIPKAADGEGES